MVIYWEKYGKYGDSLESCNIQWIGFVGKIYTGNPWVFTIKYNIGVSG